MLTSCIYQDNIHACTQMPYLALARHHANSAIYFLKSGRTDIAQDETDQALSQAPADPLVLQSAGYYYEKTGAIANAEQAYFKAVLLAPDSALINHNYGAFLCRNNHKTAALAYFIKAAKTPRYPGSVQALRNAKECRLGLGDRIEYAYDTQLVTLRKPMEAIKTGI